MLGRMPLPWTLATLEPLVGQTLQLHLAPSLVQLLRLSGAQALGAQPAGATRAPFSLTFHGPAQPWAPQGTYRVEHDQLETLDLFLVPLGPDDRGMRYQAIFT